MVEFTNNPLDLVRAFNTYIYGPGVPEVAAEQLQTIPGVQADIIVEGVEILFAHYDLLNDEGRTVLAQLTQYGINQSWGPMVTRWTAINALARHDLGEDVAVPDPIPEPQMRRRTDGVDFRNPEESEE